MCPVFCCCVDAHVVVAALFSLLAVPVADIDDCIAVSQGIPSLSLDLILCTTLVSMDSEPYDCVSIEHLNEAILLLSLLGNVVSSPAFQNVRRVRDSIETMASFKDMVLKTRDDK
ncbi:hypothetical protein EDB89DRAFT_1908660 [Lactarius sanguifluus]|nr:hypothetical protein EDB89DRAFT_1908660 [Lactarius sanguifluus]